MLKRLSEKLMFLPTNKQLWIWFNKFKVQLSIAWCCAGKYRNNSQVQRIKRNYRESSKKHPIKRSLCITDLYDTAKKKVRFLWSQQTVVSSRFLVFQLLFRSQRSNSSSPLLSRLIPAISFSHLAQNGNVRLTSLHARTVFPDCTSAFLTLDWYRWVVGNRSLLSFYNFQPSECLLRIKVFTSHRQTSEMLKLLLVSSLKRTTCYDALNKYVKRYIFNRFEIMDNLVTQYCSCNDVFAK